MATLLCFWFCCAGTKPHRLGFLLTHKNGDIGAVSETNPSCAATILKVDWDRFLCQVFMYDVKNFEKLAVIVKP